jgi:hypothetical protein
VIFASGGTAGFALRSRRQAISANRLPGLHHHNVAHRHASINDRARDRNTPAKFDLSADDYSGSAQASRESLISRPISNVPPSTELQKRLSASITVLAFGPANEILTCTPGGSARADRTRRPDFDTSRTNPSKGSGWALEWMETGVTMQGYLRSVRKPSGRERTREVGSSIGNEGILQRFGSASRAILKTSTMPPRWNISRQRERMRISYI